jgi:hypothetical protein
MNTKTRATCRKVIEVFGFVRPFVNIIEAEERDTRALLAQFEPPKDTWPARITAPRTLSGACEAAVQARGCTNA